MNPSSKAVNWFLFVLLSLIWGSSFILIKRSAETLSGMQIGAVRIFAAGLVMLPFALFHISKVPHNKIGLMVVSALLGNFFPAFLFAIAIQKIDSSMEGILNSLTPLFVIVVGVLFFKAKLQKAKVVGVLIGMVGLVVLSLSKASMVGSDIEYTLLILLATLMYGINVNLVSYYLKGIDPLKMATVSLSLVGILAGLVCWYLNVFSMVRYDEEAQNGFLLASLLGIVGTAIATALFYMLIKRAGGLFASLVTYGIPVVSIIWGLADGEDVTALQIGCLGLILSGVWIANRN